MSSICVTIARSRHKMWAAEHKWLAERGARLCELRLDYLARDADLGRLLPARPTPVIVTCRRASDRGLWRASEDARLTLLRAAIVQGVEYVDLEEDTAAAIRRYGKTKRIVSYHNFEETPHDLDEIHARLSKLDPDVIKLATLANHPNDNVRMLQLVGRSKIPTAGFCMGDLGVPSRILTAKFGGPFTYAAVSRDREVAPGQLAFDELRSIYRYESIDRDTEVYGVVADPVAHSLSPLLHNTAFARDGLNKVYLPIRVPQGMFPLMFDQFQSLGLRGLSVTLPHKETALTLTTNTEGPIQEIGAANTLHLDNAGTWWAANTDYDAALESILLGLGDGNTPASAKELEGKRVLILGAGGVARAVGWATVRGGAAVTVTNRGSSRGKELAAALGCQFVSWENRGTSFFDILVNCTSVGMHPNVDETPLPENLLNEGALVFDTVYNPEQTMLVRQARERGCRVVTGIEMFVRQAAKQYARFAGKEPSLDLFRGIVRKAISVVKVDGVGAGAG
jgi:3-dehydroquinate dehydratase/shikimate dehydrogenase